jgi:hypothetical protein
MSHMNNLEMDIRELGIDPSRVRLEVVDMYSSAYHAITGDKISTIDAIKEIYGVVREEEMEEQL